LEGIYQLVLAQDNNGIGAPKPSRALSNYRQFSSIVAPEACSTNITRGIERGKIFRDGADREDFVRRLGDSVEQTGTRCYAWALIPNHFHLLLKTGATPIATLMRRLLSGYAAGFNRQAVSLAVQREERFINQENLSFEKFLNVEM
jgi:REP element-mobilizing transposase RayT